jgi:hypothetical protein
VAPAADRGADRAWTAESRDDALARAPEFGRRFFAGLFGRFPETAAATTFRRWSVQPEDVYGLVRVGGLEFTVQIDPDLEYVIVATESANAEFGDWTGDQVGPALEYVEGLVGGARE